MAIVEMRGSAGTANESSVASELFQITAALLAATLLLSVFLLLAAIDPATWTFQSNTGSHLQSELWRCLMTKDDAARLGCYDDLARQPAPHPARGANAPARFFLK